MAARDRAIFFRGLALLFNSGVALTRAVLLLGQQTDSPALAQTCQSLFKRIEGGASIYQAMAAHREVFPPLQLRLIQVAQTTGSMPLVLMRLAEYEEKQSATSQRIRSSLAYPVLIMIVCLLAVMFLPPYLFGTLSQLVAGQKMPWPTQVVMSLSRFMQSPLPVILLGVAWVAGMVCWHQLGERPALQLKVQAWLLRVPGLGATLRHLAVTRFARALEVMTEAGIPLNHGLLLAGHASANLVLAHRTEEAVRRLVEGSTVTQSLKDTGFFPNLFLHALAAGEDAGRVGYILGKMAGLYELELETTLDSLLALLEPAVMLVMGVIAGFLVIATALPLLEVVRSL